MNRNMRDVVAVVAGAALGCAVPLAAAEERVHSTRTIRETVEVDATEACRVIVANVWGDIRIRGHRREVVSVVAVETVRAESEAAAERAAREVALEVGSADDALLILVDGPFRDRRDWRRWSADHRHRGYTVVYDLEVEVPSRCDLEARTVNEGEIVAADVAGALAVSNVNGGIRLDRMSGPGGTVTTVNGPIEAEFLRGPTELLAFRSVNGRIETTFPALLAADLRLQTTWGEMWSELELAPLAAPPPTRRRRDGRLIIESGRGAALRAGTGGPEISFETLNGDILIRKEG